MFIAKRYIHTEPVGAPPIPSTERIFFYFNKLRNGNFYFNNLSCLEQYLVLEIYVSFKFFKIKNISFDEKKCYLEILEYDKNYISFLKENEDYICSLIKDIKSLNCRKDIKINTASNNIDYSALYAHAIIKSIKFSDDVSNTYSKIINGMSSRWVVVSFLQKMSKIYCEAGIIEKFDVTSVRIIMVLNEYIYNKKILVFTNKKIKTEFFLKMLGLKTNNDMFTIISPYSYTPYRSYDNFFIGESYKSLTYKIKKSIHQNSCNTIEFSTLNKISNRGYFIDLKFLSIVYDKIYQNILKKNNNIHSTKNSSIIEMLLGYKNNCLKEINSINMEIGNKIKYEDIVNFEHITDEETVPFNLSEELENIEMQSNVLYTSKLENIKFLKNKIDEINKDIQKLYFIESLKLFYCDKDTIYDAYYYDFRGRVYPKSIISFLYQKHMRPFFLTKFDEPSSLENSKYYKLISTTDVNFKNFNIYIKNTVDKYYMTVLLIEVGKLFKTKIKKIYVSIQDFVDIASVALNNKHTYDDLDGEDFSYYLSLSNCLDHFIKTSTWNNILIIRDSTASTLQHWGVFLGVKSDMEKNLNFDGLEWCDVYSYIISIFLKEYNFYDEPKYMNILSRSVLKKIIMTINYNSGKLQCLKQLINILKEVNIPADTNELKSFINDFHNFVSIKLFGILYKKQKIQFLNSLNYSLVLDDAKINLKYYKLNTNKKEYKIMNKRWVMSLKSISDDMCA